LASTGAPILTPISLVLGFWSHAVFSASRAAHLVFAFAAGVVALISKRAQFEAPLESAPPTGFVIWNSRATPPTVFTASVQPEVPPATFQSETESAE
jgi:hypothetical protein